ncbi:hypothetical protein [Pararhizobium sp. DWP3-4]|uniref:hypothetical protein n=1 Tax=Pararhizobium sp. DWP3-4 TaxID=2804565 RepID=UPI003CF7193B
MDVSIFGDRIHYSFDVSRGTDIRDAQDLFLRIAVCQNPLPTGLTRSRLCGISGEPYRTVL